MSYRIVTTRSEATSVAQTQDKLLGYPLRGTRIGGGVHVTMPETWDGTGACPPGWSSHVASVRQHPVNQEFAVPVNAECVPALANGRRTRLTAQEQTKMAADVAAAVALPVDWATVAGAKSEGTERT